jgi:hypothetical protein
VKFRAARYRIVSANSRCAACDAWTHVVALVVPSEMPDGVGVCLHYVERLPDSVQSRLRALAPWYRRTEVGAGLVGGEPAPAAAYWTNHCEHCNARQDEYELHCEPGGAFMPSSAAEAALLTGWDVSEPFAAVAGGCSHDPPF